MVNMFHNDDVHSSIDSPIIEKFDNMVNNEDVNDV